MSTGPIPNSHRGHTPVSDPQLYRPATIAELADKSREDIWDPNKQLKHWLRTAELSRKNGKQYAEAGDYERSFVQLARAATIILEKMPTHRDYHTLLNPTQRHNLSLHGQETLDNLSKLKPGLVDRYDRWVSRNPDLANNPAIKPSVLLEPPTPSQSLDDSRGRDPEYRREESRRREAEEAERRQYDDLSRGPSSRGSQDEHLKQRVDERRIQEQVGIVHRQQEAEAAAHAARREISSMPPVLPAPVSASSQQNPGYLQGPPVMPQPQPSPIYAHPDHDTPARRQEDQVTGVMPPGSASSNHVGHVAGFPQVQSNALTLQAKLVPNRYPQPSPVTTTSPAPPSMGSIRYPSLMSQHQMKQGYVPSLHSMFQPPPHETAPIAPSSLLFQNEPHQNGLYANALPQPSVPVNYAVPETHRRQHSPIPPPITPQPPSSSQPGNDHRITPASSGDLVSKDLKTVYLPRESLPRFLHVAAINTARNRETCGLLLGKDKRSRFVVTTLLIPKQHSTSDTCTMDEEELVMSFTEERSLITLGWIHTHPTQSCFMSSVDLHTHSGFQRMLPESFAVVCAPSSTPNFGIFRLTDPPGLHTILDCTAKEAFHPHPQVPIYTDADKGHVQIKDSLSLEIVDLRDH